MTPEKISTLRVSVKNLTSDQIKILSAVAGIPASRLRQIARGEGADVTVMEYNILNMLKES